MKAAVYNGPGDVTIAEVELPSIGANDVLIRNLAAGICGTDAAAYIHGPRAHRIVPGGEFGHEVISEVAAIGDAVTEFEVGDRVYPYPLYATGDTKRAGTIGGFSEYIRVPDAKLGRHLFKVDKRIPEHVAGMIEPFTVGTRAARRARPQRGETAMVFGAGTIGIATAIALKTLGCGEVLIADFSEFRLSKAAALGFRTCNPSKRDLKSAAIEVFGTAVSLDGPTANVDIFIEAAGSEEVVETYQEMSKIFSRMVIVGVHHSPIQIDSSRLAYSQQELIGSGGYQPEDVPFVLELMGSGTYDLESIVTHQFPLEQINEALQTAGSADRSLHVSISHSGHVRD